MALLFTKIAFQWLSLISLLDKLVDLILFINCSIIHTASIKQGLRILLEVLSDCPA